MWDVATQRELLTLQGEGSLFYQVGFSPDERNLMATSFEGIAHLWRAPLLERIENADSGRH